MRPAEEIATKIHFAWAGGCRSCSPACLEEIGLLTQAIRDARREAYERAARVAEEHRRLGCGCDHLHSEKCLGRDEGHADAAEEIAYRIRALAEEGGET